MLMVLLFMSATIRRIPGKGRGLMQKTAPVVPPARASSPRVRLLSRTSLAALTLRTRCKEEVQETRACAHW